jgi:signal transduction histidine kinase
VKISHRLHLAVAPAILGVLLLASLMCWGEYGRAAPEVVIVGGIFAVLTSLVLTWSNARFVAQRLERLASSGSAMVQEKIPDPPDERDEIENYARLLASIADASTRRLEEVRLPLHILLENRFGDLNENQEEMLGAARAAAEAADADMLSLRQIAELDLGERPLRSDRMKPSDVIDALRPMLLAAAESAGATLEIDVAPLLPAVIGDRALLQDALVTILRSSLGSAERDARARIDVDRDGALIRIIATNVGSAHATVRWAAAVRVVNAHDGTVERTNDTLVIELPTEGLRT